MPEAHLERRNQALVPPLVSPVFGRFPTTDMLPVHFGVVLLALLLTPHGEELLFELGGYAYLWNDDSVPHKADEEKLSWHFLSVGEAYMRVSWNPGDLLVGVRKGEIVVHAGGIPVLIQPGVTTNNPSGTNVLELIDDGRRAVIRCGSNSTPSIRVELDRRQQKLVIHRTALDKWQFWCQGEPTRHGQKIKWQNGTTLVVGEGRLADWSSNGYSGALSVGNGLLPLNDPAPRSYPLVTLSPAAEKTVIEVRTGR